MADFADQMRAFAKKANMSIDKTVRGTAIKLFSAVIKSSPVDSGRFRANWTANGPTPASGVSGMTDASGDATIATMTQFVAKAPFDQFTLSNNLPYAWKLEYGGYPGDGPNTVGGYSKQAPSGCVRVNVARFDAILEEMARANR